MVGLPAPDLVGEAGGVGGSVVGGPEVVGVLLVEREVVDDLLGELVGAGSRRLVLAVGLEGGDFGDCLDDAAPVLGRQLELVVLGRRDR